MAAETFEYQTEYFRGAIARGKAEGRAEARAEARAEDVLRILDRRGVAVSPAVRARITECTDLPRLDTWFDRAITATAVEELFADQP